MSCRDFFALGTLVQLLVSQYKMHPVVFLNETHEE